MKKYIQNISIKYKIWAYLIGFCILLLSFLWITQVGFLNSFYKTIKIHQTRLAASAVEKIIEEKDAAETLFQIANENEVCILVLSDTATEIFSSEGLRDCVIHEISDLEKERIVQKTLSVKKEIYGNYDRTADTDFIKSADGIKHRHYYDSTVTALLFSKPIKDKAGNDLVIVVNAQVVPVDATVDALRIQLSFITVVTLMVAGILAFAIAKKVSEPIEQLNRTAKTLATSGDEIVFDAVGYKEINELSKTLSKTATELSKVEKLRRELIANISHDLRTPLTLIAGYAEVMRDIPGENSPENAQIVIDETRRLSSLVSDVLSLSKIKAGVTHPNFQEYDFTNSIKKTVDRMRELLRKDGYIINFEYDKEIRASADETLINQCFYNLIVNAVNYSGEDKTVTVRQLVFSKCVKIEVSDNGSGIEAENLPYMWDRYYKVDNMHKRSTTGAGLGLSIVKSMIIAHKGEYGVTSQKGEGSTFWFSLKI